MKRTHKHLEVVIGTQVDYLLPEGKASIPQGSQIIVPGLRRLLDLTPSNCAATLFVNTSFTEGEYERSEYAKEVKPHCLSPGIDDYEAVGVQNVFSRYLLYPRGVPVFRGYKKTRSMWARDMWDNPMKINGQRGSASVAETLPQFMGVLEEHGVSNVTVWGAELNLEVAPAIEGFLAQGFAVRVLIDLCRSHDGNSPGSIHARFSTALSSGQLKLEKYGDELQASKRKPL